MINAYDFGWIVVQGRRYTSDVLIFPDRVRANWWRKEGHVLHIEDITPIIEEMPDVLIVGTGKYGVLIIPAQTRAYIESRGIKLIAEPTDKACELYNNLSRTQKVIAALHLTC